MVRCLQRRCFAGAILALVFVSLAAQNTKAQGSANSVQCGNQEASQLLQRGHDMSRKAGMGCHRSSQVRVARLPTLNWLPRRILHALRRR